MERRWAVVVISGDVICCCLRVTSTKTDGRSCWPRVIHAGKMHMAAWESLSRADRQHLELFTEKAFFVWNGQTEGSNPEKQSQVLGGKQPNKKCRSEQRNYRAGGSSTSCLYINGFFAFPHIWVILNLSSLPNISSVIVFYHPASWLGKIFRRNCCVWASNHSGSWQICWSSG